MAISCWIWFPKAHQNKCRYSLCSTSALIYHKPPKGSKGNYQKRSEFPILWRHSSTDPEHGVADPSGPSDVHEILMSHIDFASNQFIPILRDMDLFMTLKNQYIDTHVFVTCVYIYIYAYVCMLIFSRILMYIYIYMYIVYNTMYNIISYHIISYYIIPYHIISYHIISCIYIHTYIYIYIHTYIYIYKHVHVGICIYNMI